MTDPIRESIVDLGRAVARAGLVVAAGGNIAARTGDDQLWVTPKGWSFADLSEAELVRVSLEGRRLEGANLPTSELLLHLAALRARRDVAWSVHLHPPMATLLHALDIQIRTVTTDHAFYVRSIATVPYLHPGSEQLADAAAEELAAGADVVLLRHHGCLVVADTPDLALSRAVNLEAAATATYRARLLGDDATACPSEFLDHVRGEEARGRGYGLRSAQG
jgi:ribulose-5-phosphate 4-epimerase/fuculose-1-phosphate aldolase